MDLTSYKNFTDKTAIYQESIQSISPDNKNKCLELSYVLLGLSGEVGEINNVAKKIIRDSNGEISESITNTLKKELGDVFWYTARLCKILNVSMDEVIEQNVLKLSKRLEAGTIKGSGDNR